MNVEWKIYVYVSVWIVIEIRYILIPKSYTDDVVCKSQLLCTEHRDDNFLYFNILIKERKECWKEDENKTFALFVFVWQILWIETLDLWIVLYGEKFCLFLVGCLLSCHVFESCKYARMIHFKINRQNVRELAEAS